MTRSTAPELLKHQRQIGKGDTHAAHNLHDLAVFRLQLLLLQFFKPCLLLGMRLGEGSGCPLMFRVLQGACAVLRDMATFAEGEIQDDYLAPIRAMDAFTVENT